MKRIVLPILVLILMVDLATDSSLGKCKVYLPSLSAKKSLQRSGRRFGYQSSYQTLVSTAHLSRYSSWYVTMYYNGFSPHNVDSTHKFNGSSVQLMIGNRITDPSNPNYVQYNFINIYEFQNLNAGRGGSPATDLAPPGLRHPGVDGTSLLQVCPCVHRQFRALGVMIAILG